MTIKFMPALASIAMLLIPRANAQPVFDHANSIEFTVLNADLVMIGKIVERNEEGEDTFLTVEVEETLKGGHEERRVLVMKTNLFGTHLWTVGPERRLLTATFDHLDCRGASVVELRRETQPVLRSDFTELWKPAEILKEARAVLRRSPGVMRVDAFRITMPLDRRTKTDWVRGAGLKLTVPVDQRLQQRARAWIDAGGLQKSEGVEALKHFKSAENIERMRRLLDDPSTAFRRHAEHNEGLEVKVYHVRRAALQNLRHWGVEVEAEPVLEVENWKPEVVKLVVMSGDGDPEEAMKKYTRFPNLEIVILRHSNATDQSLRRLAEMKNLRNLTLGGNVTDAGLRHLKGLTLDYLCLAPGNTDTGLEQLAAMKGIKKIDIGGAKVSREAVARLAAQRPDLDIER